jgi:hypothetical protein
MTWPVALLLAVVTLFAVAYLGAIAGLVGLKIHDAIAASLAWCRGRA